MKHLNEELKASVLKLHEPILSVNDCYNAQQKSMVDLFQVQHEGVVLFDTYKDEYCILKWEHNDTYPFDTELKDYDSLVKMMHPDDRKYVANGKLDALKRMAKKKNADVLHSKLMYECRLKDKQGTYKRFHHQYRVLELDEQGDIRLLLLFLNEIGAYESPVSAQGMCICNCRTRECYPLDKATCLTEKEMNILKLLAKGLISSNVAMHLGTSPNTINNQRGKVLEKLGANNVAHAINYARIMEII